MEFGDYIDMQRRALAALGDATDDLQAIVDAGLRIPSGFYHLKGRVQLHGEAPGLLNSPSDRAGHGCQVHAEPARVTCRKCSTETDWLAPFRAMTGVPLWCAQCEAYQPHDAVVVDCPPRTAQEIWDAGRTITGSYAPR